MGEQTIDEKNVAGSSFAEEKPGFEDSFKKEHNAARAERKAAKRKAAEEKLAAEVKAEEEKEAQERSRKMFEHMAAEGQSVAQTVEEVAAQQALEQELHDGEEDARDQESAKTNLTNEI